MRIVWSLRVAVLLGMLALSCVAADQNATKTWTKVATPFRPVNIFAMGKMMWVCGADEMILSSNDGGATWKTLHQKADGEALLNIAFVDEKVGHAAGTGGLVLTTEDGGQTWKAHVAPATVRSFSFADAQNGIAMMGFPSARKPGASWDPVDGIVAGEDAVQITHDGGEHWDTIAAMKSDELRPFTHVLAVAALDKSHYVMIRRHPEVEDAFVVTIDGGTSWKPVHMRDDKTNREMARMLFVYGGEYWALGYELVNRETGGGYGVPLNLHSKDGVTWIHGLRGPKEFDSCTTQGCYIWDGAVEELHGEQPKFWDLPQDGALSGKWGIAGASVCTVNRALMCAPATLVEKSQPAPEKAIITIAINRMTLAEGCLVCDFDPVGSEGAMGSSPLWATLKLRPDGMVAHVSLQGGQSKQIQDAIAGQMSNWLFEPEHRSGGSAEIDKNIREVVVCSGFSQETGQCTLSPAEQFPRMFDRKPDDPARKL